jgi:hypothetical protein
MGRVNRMFDTIICVKSGISKRIVELIENL